MPVVTCEEFLVNGVCYTSGCRGNHNARTCSLCNTYCVNKPSFEMHLAGKPHNKRLRQVQTKDQPESSTYQCGICNVKVMASNRAQHERGHITNAQQLIAKAQPPPSDTLKKEQRVAASDKTGVVVSHKNGVDFGILKTGRDLPSVFTQILDITNTVHGNETVLSEVHLSSSTDRSASSFAVASCDAPSTLRVNLPTLVNLQFNHRGLLGRHSDRLELIFDDKTLKKRFVITRNLFGVVGTKADQAVKPIARDHFDAVGSKSDYEVVKPIASYVASRRQKRAPVKDVIDGEKPPFMTAINWVVRLPPADIPKYLENALMNGNLQKRIDTLRRDFLPGVFRLSTYGRQWKVLLHVEELQAIADLERYDSEEETLTQLGRDYRLAVPGLAENRPSVIIGDQILVRARGSSGAWYRGYVHRIDATNVYLRFNHSFRALNGEKYAVRFQLHRLPLRRMHQAMETTFVLERVLFPTRAHIGGLTQPLARFIQNIKTVKREIGENEPQLLAIAAILNQRPGSVPFVVYGPPGTGKTVTIVEAIRQLLLRNPNARILACAPSNSAADLIAERLLDLGSQLFRLMAVSRPKDKIPKKLHAVTRHSGSSFTVPPMSDLVKFRVIVSTCVSASMLYGVGLPRGHFTHIFVDEAGQATEPELMISIKTMAGGHTNIILSGDPRQLGPIVRSPVAIAHGLGQSYLDRLVANPIYDEANGRGITLVKLLKNYRSHNAILTFPNNNFYGGELQPHADPVIINSLLRSEAVVKAGFPLVFHSLKGKDTREASSPSFFNPDEVVIVKKYVEQLLDDQRLRLKDEHLGIIAPYHAQCMKIRQLLSKSTRTKDIKVGSVEEFQGQERRVIIVSTVRSSSEYISFDLRHTLGFVANPRRFNVAVTRAQALLVVIGDPHVLSIDPLWRSFLNYAHTNGGWRGLAPDWDTSEDVSSIANYAAERREKGLVDINALADRLESVVIGQVRTGTSGLNEGHDEDAAVDKPWRDVE